MTEANKEKTFSCFFSFGDPESPHLYHILSRIMLLELVSHLTMSQMSPCILLYLSNTEKWALSYRHFQHKQTDTNMFVERL